MYKREAVKEIKKKCELERLKPHHKLIIDVLKRSSELSSTDFYDLYKKQANKQGLRATSHRSFNNYITDLIKLNYIKVERAKVRGNVRIFKYNV